jgi:hypothetical protein
VAGFDEGVHGPPFFRRCCVPALARGYATRVNLFAIVALLLGLVLIAAGVTLALGTGPLARRLERPQGEDDVAGHLVDTPSERRGLGALVAASGLVLVLLALGS